MLRVKTTRGTHLMLLGSDGSVLVDTAPQNRDGRTVYAIHAVYPKR